LLAHCLAFVPDWQQYPETHAVQAQNWPLLATAIRGINAPRASSCGRLFDAVACALGEQPMKVKRPAGWKRWLRSARCRPSGDAASG
jgi:hydrogenase maturation protein HypF